MNVKAILFDADGVAILPGLPFATQFAAEKGFDPANLQSFFQTDFQLALTGQADLMDLLERHRETWRWTGPIHELLEKWFQAENHPNPQISELIPKLKADGVLCCLATNQEKHRTRYIADRMFPNLFDHVFSSAQIGHTKPSACFFRAILSDLKLSPEEILFLDDSPANVEAGNQAGIRSYLYQPGMDIRLWL